MLPFRSGQNLLHTIWIFGWQQGISYSPMGWLEYETSSPVLLERQ